MRLARPIRCSGSNGPMARMNRPAAFAAVSVLMCRSNFSRPIVTAPITELAACLLARFRRRTIRLIVNASKRHNDFSEYLTILQARKATFEICKLDFGINDGGHSGGNFRKAVADISNRRAKRAENLVLLLKQLHQVDCRRRAGGGATCDETSTALQTEEGSVESFTAHMLENNVDSLFCGKFARDALKTVDLVIDDMIGAERLGFFRF